MIKTMDDTNRKRRLANLLTWLQGKKTQTQLAEDMGISSSSMSLFSNVTSKTPEPSTLNKQRIVEYLQVNRDRRWSIAELEKYLEGAESIESFAAKLSKRAIPDDKLTLDDRIESMDTDELWALNEKINQRLKKSLAVAS